MLEFVSMAKRDVQVQSLEDARIELEALHKERVIIERLIARTRQEKSRISSQSN